MTFSVVPSTALDWGTYSVLFLQPAKWVVPDGLRDHSSAHLLRWVFFAFSIIGRTLVGEEKGKNPTELSCRIIRCWIQVICILPAPCKYLEVIEPSMQLAFYASQHFVLIGFLKNGCGVGKMSKCQAVLSGLSGSCWTYSIFKSCALGEVIASPISSHLPHKTVVCSVLPTNHRLSKMPSRVGKLQQYFG